MSAGDTAKALQFSFAGLVSQVERVISRLHGSHRIVQPPNQARATHTVSQSGNQSSTVPSEATQREVSRLFQDAAIGHLALKLKLALGLPELAGVRGVVVSGGVASNQALRQR